MVMNMPYKILRIVDKVEKMDSINSITQLKGYQFNRTEKPNSYPGDPTEYIFLDGEKDKVRIYCMTFKHMKRQYSRSGEPNEEIDKLIQTIEDNIEWQ